MARTDLAQIVQPISNHLKTHIKFVFLSIQVNFLAGTAFHWRLFFSRQEERSRKGDGSRQIFFLHKRQSGEPCGGKGVSVCPSTSGHAETEDFVAPHTNMSKLNHASSNFFVLKQSDTRGTHEVLICSFPHSAKTAAEMRRACAVVPLTPAAPPPHCRNSATFSCSRSE